MVIGTSMLPVISHAFFPSELRKMHEESRQKGEERREKLRQDILEKRKEFLNEWHDKKQVIKGRFKRERQKTKNDVEEGVMASPSVDAQALGRLAGMFERSAKDIMHVFAPFVRLFSGSGT